MKGISTDINSALGYHVARFSPGLIHSKKGATSHDGKKRDYFTMRCNPAILKSGRFPGFNVRLEASGASTDFLNLTPANGGWALEEDVS